MDFFTAIDEELESKLYEKREETYKAKKELILFRKSLYRFFAESLLDEFIEQNKAKIVLFKGLFVQSSEYDPLTGKDGHDEFNEVLARKFNLEPITPEELKLPPFALADSWTPKLPSQNILSAFNFKQKKVLNVY